VTIQRTDDEQPANPKQQDRVSRAARLRSLPPSPSATCASWSVIELGPGRASEAGKHSHELLNLRLRVTPVVTRNDANKGPRGPGGFGGRTPAA
jgi:hypothetical protein